MSDKVKLNTASLSLTNAEFAYLASLVKGGDRAGFYLAYYGMAISNDRSEANGSTEMALQAKVASFSDDVGGVAFYTNRLLQESFGPTAYKGIYYLSQKVAERALTAINDRPPRGGPASKLGSGPISLAWLAAA